MKTSIHISLIVLAIVACSTASAQVLFEDVTDTAGPFHRGESWGATWGDFNGDNCPDLLVNNHSHRNSLWRNDCQGGFTDVMLTYDIDNIFISDTSQDTHSSTFADVDNDGDQDILSLRSSSGGRGQLFITNNGTGDEQGSSWGLNSCNGGRLGAFFDYDNDGDLDIFCSRAGYTYVFRRDSGNSFSRQESSVGMENQCRSNNYVQFGNFYTPSGGLDLSCGRPGTQPERFYDMSSIPFSNVTSINSPNISNVSDTVFADFDNDLDVDWFALKHAVRPSGASLIGSNNDKIESWIIVDKKSGQSFTDKGFTFTSTGNVTIAYSGISRITTANQPDNVYIGSSGYNPGSFPAVLDPNNTANQGISNSSTKGFFIGYDPFAREWTALLRTRSGHEDGYFVLEGTNISEPVMFNLDNRDIASTPRMHNNNNGTLSTLFGLGFTEALSCGSIAAGDLDNDMDIDLYLACRQGVENLENIIYWNDGDGTFTKGANHGGEGPVGAGLDSYVGVAESVVIADYDTDGFLDLFVTNGNLLMPPDTGGSDVLIRNKGGNGNYWIELDLVGTNSNRDGVGAKVTATAGGVTQLREQNGGYHRDSQNHTRIHFGLGPNNTSVNITVEWPDGSSDTYNNVAADSLYKVNQGGSIVPASAGPMVDFPAPQAGDECGSQIVESSSSRAIHLYKDCGSGLWHLRAVSGNSLSNINYSGTIASDQPINIVNRISLEGSDFVNQPTASEVVFSLTMSLTGEDGFDFSLTPDVSTCFNVDLPGNAQVFVGDGYHLPQLPVNLETLETCLSLTSSDVTVSEAAGMAQVDVTLLGSSSQTITVDYQTVNGSATAGPDYTGGSGTLTFNPGDTVKSFNIPIINDMDIEGDETFSVDFSNAVGAALATSSITVTIEDNDLAPSNCGEPDIDTAVDREIFIWKDCAGNNDDWHVIAAAGGGSVITYDGNIATDQTFSIVTPVSIESSDTLDSSDPQLIVFNMSMGNTWRDGFNFSVAPGDTCLTLNLPAGKNVLVGENRTPVASPFNIETLGACQSAIGIGDVTVLEANTTASVPVNLSASSASIVTVDFQTQDGSATAGLDYTGGTGTVTFNPGETSKSINVPILDDMSIEGTENFTVQLSNAVNALISDGSGLVTINDDDGGTCGQPVIDNTVDREIFVWQDCDDNEWHVRAYSGGGSPLSYVGDLTTFDSFSNVVPVSIESSDVLDTSDPKVIAFDLTMGSIWFDGFDFQVGTGGTCMTLNTPSGQDVLVGPNRQPVTPPFDIKTLGACSAGNNPPVVVNPGNQTNTVGANVSLFISATDADGDILTYSATGLPDGLSIDSQTGEISGTASSASVSNVTVTASDGSASDNESFTWTIEALPNLAPTANAGTDQTIELPAVATLDGSVSDDGLPNPPGVVTSTWSVVSGPGMVTFGDANVLNTTASFSTDGVYVLRLTADDSALTDTDDVTITVNPAPIACIDVDFESGGFNGWTNLASSTCATGTFVSGTPNFVENGGVITQVGGDHTTGSGNALYTAFNTADGTDDVDSGECTLQSPDYSVSAASDLSIWYFHGQRDAGDDPSGDYFRLEYSLNGGSSWTQIASNGDQTQNAAWTQATATIPASSNVRLRVAVSDGAGPGDLIEAGVDDLQICPQ